MRSYSRSGSYFSTVGGRVSRRNRGGMENNLKKMKKCPTLTGSKVEVASIMDLLAAFLKHSWI